MADLAQSDENPSTSSKHQKLSGGEIFSTDGIDRISKLPDSLLCHILSFLPTKLSVATSILSKRWRFLWTWVSTLDFDFGRPEEAAPNATSPVHVICRVLALRRQWRIKRFCLKWCSAFDPLHLDSWVYAAILRNVEELDLLFYNELPVSLFCSKTLVILKLAGVKVGDVPSVHFPCLKTLHLSYVDYKDECCVYKFFSGCPVLEELFIDERQRCGDNDVFELPHCILNMETLVTLRLFLSEMVVNVPSRVCLPSLKVLHLEVVAYKDGNSVRNLVSGCPVLESIYLDRLDGDNVLDFEISSPTLKCLIVEFRIYGEYTWEDLVEEFHSRSYKFRVNAPALEYLSIADVVSRSFYFENMGKLAEAYVVVYPCYTNLGSIELAILGAVRNVKVLELNFDILNAFCNVDFFDKFPKFYNLFQLDLGGLCCSLGLLRHILHKFPQLTYLSVDKECVHEEPQGEWWTQTPVVPVCLTLRLVTFRFKQFRGLEDEMEFVRYIIKNSMVLEELTIYSTTKLESDLEKRLAVMQQLAMFERGSKHCRLKFDQQFLSQSMNDQTKLLGK